MRPGDLAPDDPDLGAALLGGPLVDVGDSLAAVEAARKWVSSRHSIERPVLR